MESKRPEPVPGSGLFVNGAMRMRKKRVAQLFPAPASGACGRGKRIAVSATFDPVSVSPQTS